MVKLTDIPMALQPDNFQRLHKDYRSDPVVEVLHRAVMGARDTWVEALSGHAKIMADPLSTPTANALRSHQNASRRRDMAYERLQAATKRADAEVDGITQALSQALAPGRDAAEIRTYARTLDDAKRNAFVDAAVNARDAVTLAAVLSAPHYLSGLTETSHGLLRDRAERAIAPDAVQRRAELTKAASLAADAGMALSSAVDKLVDLAALRRAEELAALARHAEGKE